MKYIEIIEKSVPMKTKEFDKVSTERTIGFEIEIAVNIEEAIDVEKRISQIEDDLRSRIDLNEFFKKELLPREIIEDLELKPKYGYGSQQDLKREEEAKLPEYFNKLRELKKRYKSLDENSDKKEYIDLLIELEALDKSEPTKKIDDKMRHSLENKFSKNDIENRIDRIMWIQNNLPEELSDEIEDDIVIDSNGEGLDIDEEVDLKNFMDIIHENKKELVKDYIKERYDEFVRVEAEEILHNNKRSIIVQDIVNYTSEQFLKYMGEDPIRSYTYHGRERTKDKWIVEDDTSISPYGVELISPVFDNVKEGINELSKVLQFIKNIDALYTNESTGLHVNIGGIDKQNIDFLKFILLLGEKYITDIFNRTGNTYTKSLISSIYNSIKNNKTANISNKEYRSLIDTINDEILYRLSSRNMFLNVEPLRNGYNYVEIRALGGSNYENKEKSIIEIIKRISYTLEIAENPNSYSNVYLKKLSELLQQEENDDLKYGVKSVGPLDEKEVSYLYDLYKNDGFIFIPMVTFIDRLNTLFEDIEFFKDFIYRISKNEKVNMYYLRRILLKLFSQSKISEYEDVLEIYNGLYNKDMKEFVGKYILPRYQNSE